MSDTQINPVDEKYFRQVDEQIINLTKDVRILSNISWPAEHQEIFLSAWRQGKVIYPEIEYKKKDLSGLIKDLEDLYHSIDTQHPIGMYLFRTAESYYNTAQMLQNVGNSMFTTYSKILYGEPTSALANAEGTHLEAAEHFVQVADRFHFDANFYKVFVYHTSQELKTLLEAEIPRVIGGDEIRIELDPNLAPKAAAGAKRVRVRDNTVFTEYEVNQLLHHEVFTHSLTALNGRSQPILKSMGLGAARTTPSQEGLATFSELITGSMDLLRLKRISLRISAIHRALNGADFVDIFRYFLEQGEPEIESYNSAMRIFRGGTAQGGIVFTKDCSYLTGLLSVHGFFRKALEDNRLDSAEILFSGRVTVEDAKELYPFVQQGWIAKPKYIPYWFRNFHSLAANLAFSLFANKIDIHEVPSASTPTASP